MLNSHIEYLGLILKFGIGMDWDITRYLQAAPIISRIVYLLHEYISNALPLKRMPGTQTHFRLLRFAIVYALAYSVVRSSHALIHTVSFTSGPAESTDVQYFHRIETADFGATTLQSPVSQLSMDMVSAVFLPLRYGESLIWQALPFPHEELLPTGPAGTRG